MVKFIAGYVILLCSLVITYYLCNSWDINTGVKIFINQEKYYQELLAGVLLIYLLDFTLGNLLRFFSAPLRCISLGLFNIVITGTILMLSTRYTNIISIETFTGVLLFSILLTIIMGILHIPFSQIYKIR